MLYIKYIAQNFDSLNMSSILAAIVNTMNIPLLIPSFLILSCNFSPNEYHSRQNKNSNNSARVSNTVQVDTAKRPFQILFKDITEIHTGSHYNACKIELIATDKIQLPQASWQDKFAWTDDSKKLVLVKWHATGKNP